MAKMPLELENLKDWRFEIDFEDIAWAIFDRENESMNTLGVRPLEELGKIVQAVEGAASRKEVRGLIIISGKESSFIAGADIRDFKDFKSTREVESSVKLGIALFDQIEKLKVPVVAAIHGFCLGGGLELAMACHYRIADREDGTRVGLPEVKLGIFPGLNGTVRSIKLAGAMDAMQMMLTGRMLRTSAAKAIGLIDELVPNPQRLRWAARKAVLQNRKSKGAPFWKRLMNKYPIRGYLAEQMKKKTKEKVREEHYPAPFRLIELFRDYGDNYERMVAAETVEFAPLMVSDQSINLRRVFRLSELLKSQAPKNEFNPLRVHVIGAGTMGGDIAAWCVVSGMQVSLQDMSIDQVEAARNRAKKLFKRRLKKKVAIDAAMERMIPDVHGSHVGRADVVIEAIVENLEIKQKVFKGLENQIKSDAILATNTSSLKLEDIAEPLTNPGRLIGLHFFNPVAQLPLVEVIKGENSSQDDIAKGCAFVTAIKKYPLIVKSSPGFLVNRVLAPYLFSAMDRYQSGIPREKIDQAALKFGMPMGPLELCDIVGLDICQHVAEILGFTANENSEVARMVKNGKLGKKSGEGFYIWNKGKPEKEDITFEDEELEKLGLDLIKPLLDESKKCAEEKIVDSEDLIDAGVIFGTGFAPFRGGPLHFRSSLAGLNIDSASATG